ncbi:MAG: hypothetical protein Q7T76_16810 [Ferruginibacter sp.]|nr:hypothetical protein [Ferruginibacter sp.]
MQPSDKELDKLTGEAAEQVEAPGAVPDWDAMSALLDKELPQKEDRRRRPILWFVLLLLLGTGGYFLINNGYELRNGNKTISSLRSNPTIPEKQAAQSVPVISPDENINQTVTSTPGREGIQHTTTPAKHKDIQHPPIRSRKNLVVTKTASLKLSTTAGDAGEEELEIVSRQTGQAAKEYSTTITDTPASLTKPTGEVLVEVPPVAATGDKKDGKDQIIASTDTGSSIPPKKINTKKNERGFEVSLVYAPELTTIGFSEMDKPGSSYGLMVGYQLSDRVSLQTGVLKSRKNYTADGKDYKVHYPVTYPYKLAEVTGYCNMYEVPINVKYRLNKSGKISISALAGISSYFMTHESYVYKYTSNYNSYDRNVIYTTQKNYWLSLATVGVGFEKKLPGSLRVGATPYIKIPFKGMGTGELKLISTGINFSLTYQP